MSTKSSTMPPPETISNSSQVSSLTELDVSVSAIADVPLATLFLIFVIREYPSLDEKTPYYSDLYLDKAITSWSELCLWSSQDSVDTLKLGLRSCLELLWANARQMLVSSRPIVEAIDVVCDVFGGLLARVVDAFLDALLFQAREKGFDDRVVPAVAATAHARLKAVRAAEPTPVVTAILRALDALLIVKPRRLAD